MKRTWITKATLIHLNILCLLLPLHGSITVFFPEPFRFWKEYILLFFLCVWIFQEIQTPQKWIFKSTETLSASMVILTGLHLFTAPHTLTALHAARYITLGFLLYTLFKRLIYTHNYPITLQNISRYLFWGCGLSVLFGLWAHFAGGYSVLQQWYSTTISSWVPSQTIPLYHAVNDIPRMQGTASGPIEFSHLLLASLMILPYAKLKKWVLFMGILLLLTGILMSASRSAFFIAFIILAFQSARWYNLPKTTLQTLIAGLFVLITIGMSFNPTLPAKIVYRAGTSDHITRPIEGIGKAITNPLWGDLGSVGPAARAYNLTHHNDDKAFIAENIFIDYWIQLGILGLCISISFFIALWKTMGNNGRIWVLSILIAGNIATIFDMTPISILFFILLVVLSNKHNPSS